MNKWIHRLFLGSICFNQQLITLLEFMGVKESVFIEYQNECRKRLSMALIGKKAAVSLLRHTIRYYDWEAINTSGIVIPQEPFMRSLLMTLCRDRYVPILPISFNCSRILR